MQDTKRICVVNSSNDWYLAKQGPECHTGISSATTPTRSLCMHLVTIPPGGIEKAHLHRGHETAIYQLYGQSEVEYGDQLEHHLSLKTGQFLYIPPDLPHLPWNPSDHEPCVVIISRTDPDEQTSVVLLPELDAFVQDRIEQMRKAMNHT